MSVAIGVDIGQSVDPTAIVMLDTDRPEPADRDDEPELRHLIRWIERVPLGTSYDQVVERIAQVAEASRSWGDPLIVLDATGVGRPIVDLLKCRTGVPLRAVTFTSGDREVQPEYNVHRVPKRDLVTALEVVLQARRIEVVPDCPLQPDLQAELASFDFGFSARGHDTYEAASGSHDDLVMALSLAVWWGSRSEVGAGHAFMEAWRRHAAGRRP
jgi:hypothetical protein